MNDDELRSLIRAAIHKHMSTSEPSASARPESGELRRDSGPQVSLSFAQYQLDRPAGDTSCLIEPAVQCNHCGFCKCHGH
jgi:hypothetical protein